jgi:hypothetical protein
LICPHLSKNIQKEILDFYKTVTQDQKVKAPTETILSQEICQERMITEV